VRKVRRLTMLPEVKERWRLSERRVCRLLDINRKMVGYRSVKADDPILRSRIKEIAQTRIRYGYRRIVVLLRREGWNVNHKRVRRIYREENLSIRTKTPKRRRSAVLRAERVAPTAPNQSWAMDFMHDMLADGTKIRLLTIVDLFSRESVALEVGFGFKSSQVVAVLRRKVAERAVPRSIACDNGPEFVSLELDQWAYWNRVKLDFSRPGKPSDNAFCESFNNRVRQELLNPNWFRSLEDLRMQAAAWRTDYNVNHPHSSLGNLAPEEYARRSSNITQEAAISRGSVA
jgi:putative transposase